MDWSKTNYHSKSTLSWRNFANRFNNSIREDFKLQFHMYFLIIFFLMFVFIFAWNSVTFFNLMMMLLQRTANIYNI